MSAVREHPARSPKLSTGKDAGEPQAGCLRSLSATFCQRTRHKSECKKEISGFVKTGDLSYSWLYFPLLPSGFSFASRLLFRLAANLELPAFLFDSFSRRDTYFQDTVAKVRGRLIGANAFRQGNPAIEAAVRSF